MEDLSAQNNKKNLTPWIIGGILLVVLFAASAFVAGRMLNRQVEALSEGIEVDFSDAEEIPQTAPEIVGLVTAVDGDTLTVQEFNMNNTLGMIGETGVIVQSIEIENPEDMDELPVPEFVGADGPVTELVITHDTEIYRDSTFGEIAIIADGDTMPEFPDEIKIKVEPGNADEIGTHSMVTVWGERSGDRVIASVILFQPPPSIPEIDFNSP